MLLRKFRIGNHMAFWSPVELELAPGISAIVGSNNTGKSSLLNALKSDNWSPHKSLISQPHRTLPPLKSPSVRSFEVQVTGQEIWNAVARYEGAVIPIPPSHETIEMVRQRLNDMQSEWMFQVDMPKSKSDILTLDYLPDGVSG